jgi:hypothetical protein
MIITVLLPSGNTATLDVADNVLVFDGSEFLTPKTGSYVMLYALDVAALSMPFKDVAAQPLLAAVKIRSIVKSVDNTSVLVTDPLLVAAPDPSGGLCICGITCAGTDLAFVKVQVTN